jgi:glycosyltransferase involved in cell wall biosynthesis
MTPSTTVLVPTIGRMEFLPEARTCLARQTYADYRVLVLDNASSSPARAFLEEWAKDDPRVAIARVDTRVPMFANFNRGMRAVETPLVTFFHDDDVYLPTYLEVLTEALDRHPEAAFAGSNYDLVDELGRVTEHRRWIRRTELWSGPRYVEELVSRGRNPVPMPGLVFRRNAFGPEGFDETLPIHFGDFVLLMRAAATRGMVACTEPVVRIRKHKNQASEIKLSESMGIRTEVLSRYLDEFGAEFPEEGPRVDRLRRRIALAHRAGLLWGWLSATHNEEGDACLDGLGADPADVVVRSMLRWAGRHGLRPGRVGPRVFRAARSVAEALRI